MLEAISIGKKYANFVALEGASFQIRPGEIVGLLGPNGAGKTTTLRILTGFMPPTSGRVVVAGHDLLEEPREAKRVLGYLPETPPLYPELTVQETLSFAAQLRPIPKSDRKSKISSALEKTNLTDMQHRIVGRLSKGYRQRLGIAQAILHDPPFLILDEPTIGLDPKQILEIREVITELGRGGGNTAILLSSHILQEVTNLCGRVIILHRGHIVADGKISDLTGPVDKRRYLVTAAMGAGDQVKKILEKTPGIESVVDHASDLEEIFLNLTGES